MIATKRARESWQEQRKQWPSSKQYGIADVAQEGN